MDMQTNPVPSAGSAKASARPRPAQAAPMVPAPRLGMVEIPTMELAELRRFTSWSLTYQLPWEARRILEEVEKWLDRNAVLNPYLSTPVAQPASPLTKDPT